MTTDPQAVLVHLRDSHLELADKDADVRGRKVVDRQDDEIGDVDDLIIDQDERRVRFLVVGTGGFLGIGEHKLLIPVDAVTSVDNDTVHIAKDRYDLGDAPKYDPRLITERRYHEDVYGFYGYSPYWAPRYMYPRYPFR